MQMIDDDDDAEFLICPRCKNPVSVLPDLSGQGEVYFCYHCTREVEPIADDDEVEGFQPEFKLAPPWQAWACLALIALIVLAGLWAS